MPELKNITKLYPAGGENVEALKGIDLCFRENEFVSGTHKRDRYTAGDRRIQTDCFQYVQCGDADYRFCVRRARSLHYISALHTG